MEHAGGLCPSYTIVEEASIKLKKATVKELMRKSDIGLFQETHVTNESIELTRKQHNQHMIFASRGHQRSEGGLVSSLKVSFLEDFYWIAREH